MSSSKVVCVYQNVNDMEASIDFYKRLFQVGAEAHFEDWWAQFKSSDYFQLGLLNPEFDKAFIAIEINLDQHYNEASIRNTPRLVKNWPSHSKNYYT